MLPEKMYASNVLSHELVHFVQGEVSNYGFFEIIGNAMLGKGGLYELHNR